MQMKKIEVNGYGVITGKVVVDIVVKMTKNDIIKTDLLTEKGVYPYDYMNTFDKFNEEQLPSKEQFYSRLSEEDITNDDCNRAKQIRRHFNIKNMGVYRDLYLQTDALLLTYVLEQKLGTRVPSLPVLK